MAEAFSNCGHELLLLATHKIGDNYNKTNVFKYYGVKNNFSIVRKYYPDITLGWFIYGINCIRYIIKVKPDLIYSRDTFGAYLSVLFGFKTMFECHSPADGKRDKMIFPYLFKNRNMKKLVVISNALKAMLLKDYSFLKKKNILVAHDGVDIEKYHTINNLQSNFNIFSHPELIIGYFGSFYKGRGINLIIQIAQRLGKYLFVIVGGSKDQVMQYNKKVKDLDLQNIIISEFIPNDEITKHLLSCDILLMPYQNVLKVAKNGKDTSRWMSPLKMFEYMATRKPIISSNLQVLKEILINRRNAILVEPGDVNQWVFAIKEIANDSVLRNYISNNAYDDVKKYSWNNRVLLINKYIA